MQAETKKWEEGQDDAGRKPVILSNDGFIFFGLPPFLNHDIDIPVSLVIPTEEPCEAPPATPIPKRHQSYTTCGGWRLVRTTTNLDGWV